MKPTKAVLGCTHGPLKHRIVYPWGSVEPVIECAVPGCDCVRKIGEPHEAGRKKE